MSTLDEIEKRLAATTPGEWEAVEHTDAPEEFWCVHTPDGNGLEWSKADCQFIAHSKADIQSLLALARAVRQLRDGATYSRINGVPFEAAVVEDQLWAVFDAFDAMEKPADG